MIKTRLQTYFIYPLFDKQNKPTKYASTKLILLNNYNKKID